MPKIILFVGEDDAGFQELPKHLLDEYSIHSVPTCEEALAGLGKNDDCFLIIVEFSRDGQAYEDFFKKVGTEYPSIVRVLLTTRDNFKQSHATIHAAQEFQLLERPYPPEILLEIIEKGIDRFGIQLGKQQALRRTLLGSVRAMVDILDMVNPEAMGFAKRIRRNVLSTGKALGFNPIWQLELAVMLSHVGCIALPAEVVRKVDQGTPLSPEDKQMFGMHPSIAASLVDNIPKMAPVATIIKHQHECLSKDQPLGSRIIKVALDVDRLERKGKEAADSLGKMLAKPDTFDSTVVKSMLKLIGQSSKQAVREIDIEDLKEGMVMARDLVNKEGVKLLLRGQAVSKASLNRLQLFHIALGVTDTVAITDKP